MRMPMSIVVVRSVMAVMSMVMMGLVMIDVVMRVGLAVAVLRFFWVHQVISASARMSACATARGKKLSPIKQ